jgi:hypothetical protein
MILVSGENWQVLIQFAWALIVNINFLSLVVKTLRVLSSDPDKIRLPSDDKATLLTGAEWDLMV